MGSINIDNTGSGADVSISSDGTNLLLDGTAVGGGGADLYAANESSPTAQPSATGANAIAIGDGATAGGDDAFAIGDGASATANFALALGRNSTASNFHNIAIGESSAASGNRAIGIGRSTGAAADYSTALGVNSSANGSKTATGQGAMALGGSYASGTDSFAAAIANNTSSYGATGANSIAIGQLAKATGTSSVQIGRLGNTAGDYSVGIGNGSTCSSNAILSVALAATYLNAPDSLGFGAESRVDSGHDRSVVLGRGAKSRTKGGVHFGGFNAINAGNNQAGIYILVSDTTDATAEALTTNNSTASSDNQIILPNNSAYSFSGTIIAREDATDGSDYASWEIKGALLRDANAASTVLGNGIVNKLYATSGASAWAIALTADTTNGGLKVEVTGAAATNIRWVATVNTSEVTYA